MTIQRTRVISEEVPTPRWQPLPGREKVLVLLALPTATAVFYALMMSLVPVPSTFSFAAYVLFAALHGAYAIYHYRVTANVDRYVRQLIDEPHGGGRKGWRRVFFTWECNISVAAGLFLVAAATLREADRLWVGVLFTRPAEETLNLVSWLIVVWNQVASVFFVGSLELFGLSRQLVTPAFPVGVGAIVMLRLVVVAGAFLALKRAYDTHRRIVSDLEAIGQTFQPDAEERLKRYGAHAVPAILRAIGKRTTNRDTAVEILGYVGDRRAVRDLRKLLDDSDNSVRAGAVEALASCDDWRCLPRLRTLITDADEGVRKAVVAIMGTWKTPLNAPVLRAGLRDPKESVREIAVKGLCTLIREGVGTEEDVTDLLSAVRSLSSLEQLTALQAVATAVRERAMPLLEELRDGATEDLTKFGAIRLRYAIRTGELDRDDPWLKAEGGNSDSSDDKPRAPGFDERDFDVALALLTGYDSDVRDEVASLLAESKDPRALDPLLKLLEDPDPEVREGGARAVGTLERPEAAPALVPLLRDPSADVRSAAARTLGDLEAPESLDALVGAYMHELDEEVRLQEFLEISFGDNGRYRDLALAALDDKNPEIQELAVKYFGRNGEPRALPVLLRLLKSERNELRLYSVLGAIQQAGDPSAAVAIEPFLSHESEWVRRAATEALAWFRAAEGPEQVVTVGPEIYGRLNKYPFFRAWKEGRLSKELFLENMQAFRSDFFHEEGITPEQYRKVIDTELQGASEQSDR